MVFLYNVTTVFAQSECKFGDGRPAMKRKATQNKDEKSTYKGVHDTWKSLYFVHSFEMQTKLAHC